ncbi:MAG: DUF2007 domain-containing protein [Bacteroidales bacterium]|nr:DUF2007 domain-containing protein [Bacteroidales bacterium]
MTNPTPKGNQLVLARVFEHDVPANIAMGMLRANGIPCILDHEIVSNVFGIQLTPCDGIRLMVRRRDLPVALKLLRECDD